MCEIQGKATEQGNRNPASRFFHSKNDKDKIAGWKQDLNSILQVFNVRSCSSAWRSLTALQTELLINSHMILLDIRRDALAGHEGTAGGRSSVSTVFNSPTKH